VLRPLPRLARPRHGRVRVAAIGVVALGLGPLLTGCSHERGALATQQAAKPMIVHETTTTAPDASTTTTASTTTGPPASIAPTTIAPSHPCAAPTEPMDAGLHTITSSGVDRDELVDVPVGFDRRQPAPVLLNLHGSGSDLSEQSLYSRFPTLATARGYVVVTPNGTGIPRGWQLTGPADMTFVSDLLTDLGHRMCIDPRRVFVAGISNGSAFAGELLCRPPFQFAAAGMVASPLPDSCPAGTDRPIIEFHGTDDPIVPYHGGQVNAEGFAGVVTPDVRATAAGWASHDGCGASVDRRIAFDVVRTNWNGCARGADVVLYTIEGGGHTWPGPIDVAKLGITDLGATTSSIDASQLMLDFFDRHPLP
jgi:polyhydroxybutyrate depolymerase